MMQQAIKRNNGNYFEANMLSDCNNNASDSGLNGMVPVDKNLSWDRG
jgi:hypothetical protein